MYDFLFVINVNQTAHFHSVYYFIKNNRCCSALHTHPTMLERKTQQLDNTPTSKHLVTVGRKNFPLTGRYFQ